jgi:hypothetical protein
MLIAARHMYGTLLEALDGTVGTLYDVLFDDQSWKLRHLVATTDRWFFGEQVLLDLNTHSIGPIGRSPGYGCD